MMSKTYSASALCLIEHLKQGFLTVGTCICLGYEAPKQGVRDEASE